MSSDVAAIVLAAGQGTRFRSQTPKVLHDAAGRTLLAHVLEALRPLELAQVLVVVGHDAEAVQAEVDRVGLPGAQTVTQEVQRGTGHAVEQAVPALAGAIRRVMVLPGDTPAITPACLTALLEAAGDAGSLLTTVLDDPGGYGRIVRGEHGQITAVVEDRDADDRQRAITEVNAGMYVFDRAALTDGLGLLDDDNAQGERYLTDVVAHAAAAGQPMRARVAPADEVAGVNDRVQLAEAAAVLRRRHLRELQREVGVTVIDPAATYLDVDVEVGPDTTLLPGTILDRGTRVGAGAVVGPHSHLTACAIGDGAQVHSTRAIEATIGEGASVGPYAHLRAGTVLGAATKVGAYVETKNATIGEGSKVPHLAYVGDATVGQRVNIACGAITVNYDGRTKSHTTIEDGAFVGCDTMLIAPVTIGAGAYTAAGSTVTDDVPADALAIARSRQTNKDGWAARRRE